MNFVKVCFVLFCFVFVSFSLEALPSANDRPFTGYLENETFIDGLAQRIKHVQQSVHREIPKYIQSLKSGESLWAVCVSLFVAFLYGVVHTLGPGHAKTLVSTYFLTRKSEYMKGIMLGVGFSITHVSGAVVLVFLADISLRTLIFNPESQLFWIKLVSYSSIFIVSLFMFVRALQHFFSTEHVHHCTHCARMEKKSSKDGVLLSVSAGIVPCTGSLLILLYAMAHDVFWYGVLMVSFLALGMSCTLVMIGFISIFTQRRYSNILGNNRKFTHRIKIFIESVGALFLLVLSLLFLYSLYV